MGGGGRHPLFAAPIKMSLYEIRGYQDGDDVNIHLVKMDTVCVSEIVASTNKSTQRYYIKTNINSVIMRYKYASQFKMLAPPMLKFVLYHRTVTMILKKVTGKNNNV
jgi:hypothetical protein